MPAKTKKQKPVTVETKPQKDSGTKVIVWVLVGCLGITLLVVILFSVFLFWGAWKFTKEMERGMLPFGQNQESFDPTANLNQNLNQPPQVNYSETPSDNQGFLPPSVTEKNMGYIQKVYTKNGKNYLSIDYIQWLTGTEAEKAMREDGQCPKTGECIVFDDYYIRNQNPLVRTFEVSPDAPIIMQTLDSEKTGDVNQNKPITFAKLQEIFTTSSYKQRYQSVPFIVEIGNKQIVKINEQYIP